MTAPARAHVASVDGDLDSIVSQTALWTFHMDPEPLKRLKAVIESGIDVNVSEMASATT